jgi:CheY-like chemotaxis protein
MGRDPEALAGLHIVVVEDDARAREILGELLKYFGANVTLAGSARDGLATLREIEPDVVVADMRLGDHTASWLLREARKRSCRAPFVAVTAYDFEERTVRAQGFSALLRKPLRGEPLLEAVTTAATRR